MSPRLNSVEKNIHEIESGTISNLFRHFHKHKLYTVAQFLYESWIELNSSKNGKKKKQ